MLLCCRGGKNQDASDNEVAAALCSLHEETALEDFEGDMDSLLCNEVENIGENVDAGAGAPIHDQQGEVIL